MNATQIVGYTYNTDMFCISCILDAVEEREGAAEEILAHTDTESWLDSKARDRGIDRMDETTFDSGCFPKVVFAPQSYMDYCGLCQECLTCGNHALMHETLMRGGRVLPYCNAANPSWG